MRIDRQDRGGERGGGNGNQRRLVFNPRKEGSEENFPLSSPETSLTRQTSSLLRRCVLVFFVFFSFISKLSKLQMLGIRGSQNLPSLWSFWIKFPASVSLSHH